MSEPIERGEGEGPAGPPRVRLFVAVWPSEAVQQALRQMRRAPGDSVRWLPENQWHVTLEFLGTADPVASAERLARLAHPVVPATVGESAHVLARSAVVLPVDGLDGLARAVRAVMGEGAEPDRSFIGHLTVGRLRRGTPVRGLHLPALTEPITWPVDDVCLVRSDLSERGATYTVLERVGLERAGLA